MAQQAEPMDQIDPIDRRQAINLRYLVGILIRHRILIAAIIVAIVAAGLVLTLLVTPRYTATASVQIDQETQRVLQSEDNQSASAYQDADRFLKTQVDVLQSRRLAERVATELRLFNGDDFLVTMREKLPTAELGNVDGRRREAVLRALAKGLRVYLPTDSRVIQIGFISPDPAQAARIANTYADSYMRYNLERRYDGTAYARDFLSRQLADAKVRLEASERDTNNYARSIGLIRLSQPGDNQKEPQSITNASLAQLNTVLNQATTDRIAAESKWQATAGAGTIGIAEVVNNQAMQTLIGQKSEAQAALNAELQRHRDDFPTVAPLRAQVREIDQQILALSGSIRRTIQDEYRITARREKELQSQVARIKTETQAEQDRSVKLNILTREADTNRELYNALLQRYKELSAEAGIAISNVSLIDKATAPFRPSSPNLIVNLLLSTILGFLVAAVVVFLHEQVDDRIRRPDDLEDKLGLRPLGIIPLVDNTEDPLTMLKDPKSTLAEAYYALRTALQLLTANGAPRRMMVTSAQPAEGKTTSAIALAQKFTELGRSVLLIDADLRRPSLHRRLGASNELGLSNLLTGQNAAGDVVQDTEFAGLKLIPSGPIPPSPTELLASFRFGELMTQFEQQFDMIVIDAPPVLGLADVPILSAHAPMLFVVRANMAHNGAAKGSLRRLRAINATILGAVFTQFDFDAARKLGYGDGYEYGSGYEYYRYE